MNNQQIARTGNQAPLRAGEVRRRGRRAQMRHCMQRWMDRGHPLRVGEVRHRGRRAQMGHCMQRWMDRRHEVRRKKKLLLTPVTQGRSSGRDFNEQMNRISNGAMHLWDDSSHNKSVPGDYFIYSNFHKNTVRVYKILDSLSPQNRLSTWSDNVGHQGRNVIILSSTCYYTGTLDEFISIIGYSPNWHANGTQPVAKEPGKSMYIRRVIDEQ